MRRLLAVFLAGAMLLSSVSARAQVVERALAPIAPVLAVVPSGAFHGVLPLQTIAAVPAPLPQAFPATPPAPAAAATVQEPVSSALVPAATRQSPAARMPALERLLQPLRKVASVPDSSALTLKRLYGEKMAAEDAVAEPAFRQTAGLPIKWVQRQLGKNLAAETAILKRQKKLQRNGFATAALNLEVLARHNNHYTTELPVGRVTDQKKSGRCWIFAGLNMIRSMLIAQGKVAEDFEFSENYLYFFSQLERSNRHLENVISMAYAKGKPRLSAHELSLVAPNIGDGGNFASFQLLVEKYGLVPGSAMPETKSSAATADLDAELNDSLGLTIMELMADARRVAKGGGANGAKEIRAREISRIMKILSAHLGTPPVRFELNEKTQGLVKERKSSYTPQRFSKNFVGFKFDDYVQVASWPYKKRGVAYERGNSGIGAPGPHGRPVNYRYLNVDMDRLEALSIAALKGGQPVYVYVSMGRDTSKTTGIMHPQIYDRASVYGLSRQRPLSRAQAVGLGLNTGNHLMVLTGFDRPDPRKPVVKFKIENSWGGKFGDRGVFHMYRGWFRNHVFNVIVHKSLLTTAELRSWKEKAEPLK